MELDPKQIEILRIIKRFSRITRYAGTLPERIAWSLDQEDLERLMANKCIERVGKGQGFRQKCSGFRLTDLGDIELGRVSRPE